ERKQEGDRPERLLAAGQEREPRDPLPGRTELDLDPGLGLPCPFLRLDEAKTAFAAREQRRGDLLEVCGDCGERLVEPAPHRLRQLVTQRLHVSRRLLEVLELR